MKINKSTIIRTIVLFLSLLNIILQMFGVKTLPIDNETINEAVSVGILVASSIVSWWKNNSFSEKAIKADNYLKTLREEE
jgi:SPP1 family holin